MGTVLEKVQKLTYAENFAMALYQVFTSIKNSIISENLVLLTQNEQFRAKSAHIRPTINFKIYITSLTLYHRSEDL